MSWGRSMSTPADTRAGTVRALARLALPDVPPDVPGTARLTASGATSRQLITFLDTVDRELGIDWDRIESDHLPLGTLDDVTAALVHHESSARPNLRSTEP